MTTLDLSKFEFVDIDSFAITVAEVKDPESVGGLIFNPSIIFYTSSEGEEGLIISTGLWGLDPEDLARKAWQIAMVLFSPESFINHVDVIDEEGVIKDSFPLLEENEE